jgi:hypothetical protein
MIISSEKAIRSLKGLEQLLDLRFTGVLVSTDSFDANGFPQILLAPSSGAVAGGDNFLIKIVQAPGSSNDIFGNATYAYTPNIIQLAYETGSSVTIAQFVTIMLEIGKMGFETQLYATPAGHVPTAADITAGNLVLDLQYDILWPTKGN